jgi:hypothetical protein
MAVSDPGSTFNMRPLVATDWNVSNQGNASLLNPATRFPGVLPVGTGFSSSAGDPIAVCRGSGRDEDCHQFSARVPEQVDGSESKELL